MGEHASSQARNDNDDNCPLIANESQANLDNDNLGDACDDDLDGDGFNNEIDNCPTNSNDQQEYW